MNRTEAENRLPPLLSQVKVWQLETTGNMGKSSRRNWQTGRCLQNIAANVAECFVRTQVFYSKPSEVLDSVPQFSVSGPFMFDIY